MSFPVAVINDTGPGIRFITASIFPKSTCVIAYYWMMVDIMGTMVLDQHNTPVWRIRSEVFKEI